MTVSREYIAHPSSSFRITPELTFEQAAECYIRSRAIDEAGTAPRRMTRRRARYSVGYISPRTAQDYQQYIRSLALFFHGSQLDQITIEDFRQYQSARATGSAPFIRKRRPHEEPGPCPAGPKKINQELALLIGLLRRAGLWKSPLSEEYEEMLEPQTEIPRALTLDEEECWLTASRSVPHLYLVHWYSLLALHTCMSTNELASLKLGDIAIDSGVVTVPLDGAKNRYRHRTIPLDPEALWAIKNLLIRAHAAGAINPEHYLFPFRYRTAPWDVTRPMTISGLKWAWNEVRKLTGLTWFRQYDLRHTAITRMAEAGIPQSTIMAFAGHISALMTQHYTHISGQSKMRSMEQVRLLRARKTVTPLEEAKASRLLMRINPLPPPQAAPQTPPAPNSAGRLLRWNETSTFCMGALPKAP